MAVTIAKKARTAVAIAVISPDRSTDMGEANGVPQGWTGDQAAPWRTVRAVPVLSRPIRGTLPAAG
jgi:hypothetical protein